MFFRYFLPALVLSLNTSIAQDGSGPAPEKSMLRVNITSQAYNFGLPWQKVNPGTRRGLGALLPGNRVLVTAELAQDANYVELEIAATGRKLTAKVEAVDYEVNLATIIPAGESSDFFSGMIPLPLDTTLKPKATVDVWQFENNGAPVISQVNLNRADLAPYFLEDQFFLVFEANGPVQYRAGTFTLPVVHEGKLAGMLTRYNSRDQVSEMIPPVLIQRFLDDAAVSPYEGFPNFGAKIGTTLDPQLRSFLKINAIEGGLLVTGLTPGFSAERAGLKENDVIVAMNGFKLDSRGYYVDPNYGLLGSGHLVRGQSKPGDILKLSILRDGMPMEIDCKMQRRESAEYLVDPYMFDRGPRYQLLGGLLFQELTLNYLQLSGKEWRDRAPFRLLYAQTNQEEFLKHGRRKLVFLSGVLPTPSTVGYERLRALIVTQVNGKTINDIKDLAEAIESPVDGIHRVEFSDFPKLIHVDAAQADEDSRDMLPKRFRINRLQRLD